jgi:hypothetical protein
MSCSRPGSHGPCLCSRVALRACIHPVTWGGDIWDTSRRKGWVHSRCRASTVASNPKDRCLSQKMPPAGEPTWHKTHSAARMTRCVWGSYAYALAVRLNGSAATKVPPRLVAAPERRLGRDEIGNNNRQGAPRRAHVMSRTTNGCLAAGVLTLASAAQTAVLRNRNTIAIHSVMRGRFLTPEPPESHGAHLSRPQSGASAGCRRAAAGSRR